MTARFFLGVTEAGLFPGVNYYLSCWYKRDEFAVRAVSARPSLKGDYSSTCLAGPTSNANLFSRPSSSRPQLCQAPSAAFSRQQSKTWMG